MITLDYLVEPIVITRVFIRGKKKSQIYRSCDDGSRDLDDVAIDKECRQPLKAGRGKGWTLP